jgi:hypothetical protein
MNTVYDGEVRSINPPINYDPLNPFFRGKFMAIVGNHDDGYPMPPPPLNNEIPPWGAIGIDIDLHQKSIPYPFDARPGVFTTFCDKKGHSQGSIEEHEERS